MEKSRDDDPGNVVTQFSLPSIQAVGNSVLLWMGDDGADPAYRSSATTTRVFIKKSCDAKIPALLNRVNT